MTTKYRALINIAYPRWAAENLGEFETWAECRKTLVTALMDAYPGKWEVNYEKPDQFSQYSPTDAYVDECPEYHNYCLGMIDPLVDEQEQLEKDIARLSAELSNKQQRLAQLRGRVKP